MSCSQHLQVVWKSLRLWFCSWLVLILLGSRSGCLEEPMREVPYDVIPVQAKRVQRTDGSYIYFRGNHAEVWIPKDEIE